MGLTGQFNTAMDKVRKAARQASAPQLQPSALGGNTAQTGNFLGAPSSGAPLQNPGNNFVNPGYGEQALLYTQNQLMSDPWSEQMQHQYAQTQMPSPGEGYMAQNLGTLDGPGQGAQYWNQTQGQFMDPFAGEQFTREATQNFSPTGAAGAFYDQSMGQYGQFTNYSGPGNTQGQYGQSSAALSGGTAGESTLGQIAGGYGQHGQYSGPNLAAGQYGQTQQAFGDMPIANFDPFYDRARQLATQDYNRQSAGRGVYGSSEALSGVGNVITDIEAQRANRAFDAEMQRTQEQRMRQQLLGEQARQGDLSSLGAFQANLSGAQTYGQLANMQGQLELDRHQTLGNLANMADTQALGAQNANIAGLQAFGTIANNADRAETDRYTASTSAMSQADQNELARMKAGADVAFRVDENDRADFDSSMAAANNQARLKQDRTRLGMDIANTGSDNDLNRLDALNAAAQGAESQRQQRLQTTIDQVSSMSRDVGNAVTRAQQALMQGDQAAFEDMFAADIAPALQQAGYSQKQIDDLQNMLVEFGKAGMAKQG